MTPRGSNTQRTPYMTGTPGGGITPGAMSMANANTPYGGGTTPGGGYNVNTPYTPSGVTPILTPYNTPMRKVIMELSTNSIGTCLNKTFPPIKPLPTNI